jgi:CheY-like chemotaxis protein
VNEQKKELGRVVLEQRVVGAIKEPFRATAAELGALSERYGVPSIDLAEVCIPLALLELVPQEIAEIHRLLIVREGEEGLYVAMQDPSDSKSLDELSFVVGKPVFPLVVPGVDLEAALSEAYRAARRGDANFLGPRYQGPAPQTAAEHAFVPVNRGAFTPHGAVSPTLRQDVAPAPASPVVLAVPDLDFEGAARTSRGAPVVGRQGAATSAAAASSPSELPTRPVIVMAIHDPELARLCTDVLQLLAAQLLSADGGERAIDLIKQASPSLLLLDVFLPGTNVFELAGRLRASRRFAALPVVLVSSGQRGWALVEDARRLGIELCLQRPTSAELRTAIVRALGFEDRSGRALATELLQAGLAAFRDGDAKRAVAELERAVQIDPGAIDI